MMVEEYEISLMIDSIFLVKWETWVSPEKEEGRETVDLLGI